jgi:hypothetical protein
VGRLGCLGLSKVAASSWKVCGYRIFSLSGRIFKRVLSGSVRLLRSVKCGSLWFSCWIAWITLRSLCPGSSDCTILPFYSEGYCRLLEMHHLVFFRALNKRTLDLLILCWCRVIWYNYAEEQWLLTFFFHYNLDSFLCRFVDYGTKLAKLARLERNQ